ncbi:MAG TPA: DUF4277 domain-containing protein [Clostridia bacterium]|nr:DUF4277 domain-containing protein [Clostridia bacterium]
MVCVYHDSPAPLITAMCRSVGLTKTIDEMLRWHPSRCRLSPGSSIEVIIINAFTNRCPQLQALGCS